MADELRVDDSSRVDQVLNRLKDHPAYSAGIGLMVLILIGSIGFVAQNGVPSVDQDMNFDDNVSAEKNPDKVEFSEDNQFTVDGKVVYQTDKVISDFSTRSVVLRADGNIIGRDTVNPDAEGVGTFSIYVAGFKDVRGKDISVQLTNWGSSQLDSWKQFKSEKPDATIVNDGVNADVRITKVDQAFN